jgi:RHS repeat-associated protein
MTYLKSQNIKSHSDYYPFGMQMPGRNGNSGEYRYGFQGQEKDDEIKGEGNSVNYKYRMHDPRIGRFFAVDPLARKYPFYSPYAFSGNQVIHMIELEGLEPTAPRYKWETSHGFENLGDRYKHNNGYVTNKLMKVEGYWVYQRSYASAESAHGYREYLWYDEENKQWKDFPTAKPTCTSCELDQMGRQLASNAVYYGVPAAKIFVGVVAIAAAIPSGGTSLSLLGATGVGFSIVSGSYSVASGTAELTYKASGKDDVDEVVGKIPGGYLEATIGMTITYTAGENEYTEMINGTLSIIEGRMTLNLKDPTSLQKFSNAINVTKMTIDGKGVGEDLIKKVQSSLTEKKKSDD